MKKFPYQLLGLFFYANPISTDTKIKIYFSHSDNIYFRQPGINVLLTNINTYTHDSKFDLVILFDDEESRYSVSSSLRTIMSDNDYCVWYYRDSSNPYHLVTFSNLRWTIRIVSALLGSKVINP